MVRALAASGLVEYAAPNVPVRAMAVPNEPAPRMAVRIDGLGTEWGRRIENVARQGNPRAHVGGAHLLRYTPVTIPTDTVGMKGKSWERPCTSKPNANRNDARAEKGISAPRRTGTL